MMYLINNISDISTRFIYQTIGGEDIKENGQFFYYTIFNGSFFS